MKKYILMILVVTLLFAGCGQTAPTTPSTMESTTQNTTQPSEPEVLQEDMSAVALPATVETVTTEDGALVFTYTSQTMSLVVPDPDVADKIIIDFLSRQDTFRTNAEDIRIRATQQFSDNGWIPYFYNVLYDPMRIDQNVLSLAGTAVSWSGGAHPNYTRVCASYDMVTGDVLTIGSILTHQNKADALSTLLEEAVALAQDDYGIWDGYETVIRARFGDNINYDEAWYFDNTGLCFSFSPYEIAPYASGVVTICIPYEKLVGIIEDAYFPVEHGNSTGTIQAGLLADANMDYFTQISEIVLDPNGTMMILFTDKAIYDVTIEVGKWEFDMFTPEYTAFATSSLTPGDAIMLQAVLTEEYTIRLNVGSESCFIALVDNDMALVWDAE